MNSWVYVFSKFTPEALLFEALLISILCCSYAAYWVLRKRKLGAVDTAVPASLVKGYLNELILDAEQLRSQLFGLLSAAGITPTKMTTTAAPIAQSTGSDPMLANRLAELEAKMIDQARAMDAIVLEKARLEKELASARAGAPGASAAPAASGGDPAAMAKMQEKISSLQAKLAEYSVIEDDLANLKRLQQENAQLRAALSGKGIKEDQILSSPSSAAGAGASGNTAPPPAAAVAAVPETAPANEPAMAQAATAMPAANAPAPTAGAMEGFEGLVDQVEQSLKAEAPMGAPTEAPMNASAPGATEPAAEAAAAPASAPEEKTDADLVAEFEKMLNG